MKASYTFAISLPRFVVRYRHISAQLHDRIGDRYEILGVDGRDLALSECLAPQAQAQNISPSQAGCALSHVAAYRRMLELDLPHAFVIEDDVILPANIEDIVAACLPHLSPLGVISLYSPRPSPTNYSRRGAPVLASGQLLAPTDYLNTHCAAAYLIGRDAAAGIITCNAPVRHLADHWFAFHAEGAIGRVLLHYPMPISVAHFNSSIDYDGRLGRVLKSIALKLPPVRHAVQRRRELVEMRNKANIIVVDAPTFYERKGS